MEVVYLEQFQKDLDLILKNFPKSKDRIEQEIRGLTESSGDRYPGFGENINIRKVRIGLPEYRLSKSDGLRIICLFLMINNKKIPLLLYHKKKVSKEQEVKKYIIQRLKEIIM